METQHRSARANLLPKGILVKAIRLLTSIALTLLMSSCNSLTPKTATSTVVATTAVATPTSIADTTYPLLKTTMGDFVVLSARLVDRGYEDKAPDGYKFLLIGLVRPDLHN